jgi:hypothetical protein
MVACNQVTPHILQDSYPETVLVAGKEAGAMKFIDGLRREGLGQITRCPFSPI